MFTLAWPSSICLFLWFYVTASQFMISHRLFCLSCLLRYSLQEDDLLEWDSYSPPLSDATTIDDIYNLVAASGGRERGTRNGADIFHHHHLYSFGCGFSSSSSCGVLSDCGVVGGGRRRILSSSAALRYRRRNNAQPQLSSERFVRIIQNLGFKNDGAEICIVTDCMELQREQFPLQPIQ